MSTNVSVDVEGDHVECTQCTCMPPKPRHKNKGECHAGQKYLKNWEKWVVKRKQVHEHLSKSLNRPAGDLLMNLDGDFRKIQEERLMFGYCKINTYFDKYRGNPAFWKVPVGLAEKSGQPRNPIYFANMTKIEQNEVPVIKHVTTPNYIKTEKNISPCRRRLFPTHLAGENSNMRMLSSKIKKIEPYHPECEELIIIGQKVEPEQENIVLVQEDDAPPEIQNYSPSDVQELSGSASEEINATPRNCFVINETTISGYNELENSVMKIRLIYEGTTDKDKAPEVQYLKFKNIGRTALRFYWNRIEKFLLFRDLIKCDREECNSFYFNKNELLLIPEETMDFPIWFKSSVVGNYFEMWEITTKPKMWDINFKLILNLQAFVYPPNFDDKSKIIQNVLDERIGNTIIRCCLNDILLYLKFKESEADNFSFTEKQLFESANQETWGVEKRPKYVYYKESVKQLKLLYDEVKLRYAPKQWNYSIRELRMLARKKDIWMYVENETKEMLKGKQRRTELHITAQENVKNPPQTSDNKEAEGVNEMYSRRLDSILQGLERPCMITNTERSKHFIVYTILRNFSFKMSYALAKYENPADPLPDDCYPCYDYRDINTIEQLPDRILFEKFDDVWIDRVKTNPEKNAPEIGASPKPDILKDVSKDDCKAVFKLYFNISDQNEKSKKNKTLNKDDSRVFVIKEPEKISKSRITNVDQVPSYMRSSKENFDPFSEEYIPNIFEKEPKPKQNERIQNMNKINFDYFRYLVVCTYLIEAVEAMVDALESFKENTLDTEVLGEITKCTDINLIEFLPKDERSSTSSEGHGSIVSLKIEEDPYFHILLDSHLNKNLYTKEYIVEGRSKISREESMPPNNCQESPELESFDSWVFKSRDTIAESVKSTASAQVQTSDVDGDFKNITDEFLKNDVYLSSTASSSSEKVFQDNFYFMSGEEEVSNLGEEVSKKEKPEV